MIEGGRHRRVSAPAPVPASAPAIDREADPVYAFLVRVQGIVIGADDALAAYSCRLDVLEMAGRLSLHVVALSNEASFTSGAIFPWLSPSPDSAPIP